MSSVRGEKKLHVFFSAPSVSDEEKKELFGWLRGEILKAEVEFTYDWLNDSTEYSPEVLYKRIVDGISRADLMIAELSFPSTGVGQQLGMALTKKIPVLGLVSAWKKVPRKFTVGAQSDIFQVEEYTKKDAGTIIRNYLRNFGRERFLKFNFISTPDLNEALEGESEKIGISRSQLLRKIIREWLDFNRAG